VLRLAKPLSENTQQFRSAKVSHPVSLNRFSRLPQRQKLYQNVYDTDGIWTSVFSCIIYLVIHTILWCDNPKIHKVFYYGNLLWMFLKLFWGHLIYPSMLFDIKNFAAVLLLFYETSLQAFFNLRESFAFDRLRLTHVPLLCLILIFHFKHFIITVSYKDCH